jgi:plastocyanin
MAAVHLSDIMLGILLGFSVVGSIAIANMPLPSSFAQLSENEQSRGSNIIQEEIEDVTENATEAAQSIINELTQRLRRIEIPNVNVPDINIQDINIPTINFPNLDLGASEPSLLGNLYNLDPDIDQAPFPPPVIGGQRDAPDYTIDIPHSAAGENPTFEPAEIGVPVGTTIMWINKDTAPHTVTTFGEGLEFSPPESFDSGHIPGTRSGLFEVTPFGGSFIYTFDKPGVYEYFCTIHPNHEGRIVVGDTIQLSQNGKMILMEGANLPFNASELSRILLAVVPSKEVIDLPPTTTMTYNVSLLGPPPQSGPTANQTGIGIGIGLEDDPNQVLYTEQFLDTDGVLYLELIPQPAVNGSAIEFLTWGPDISATATGPHTGAFHIKGPALVQNEFYTMQVSIVNIDGETLEEPIIEEFILSPKLASPASN